MIQREYDKTHDDRRITFTDFHETKEENGDITELDDLDAGTFAAHANSDLERMLTLIGGIVNHARQNAAAHDATLNANETNKQKSIQAQEALEEVQRELHGTEQAVLDKETLPGHEARATDRLQEAKKHAQAYRSDLKIAEGKIAEQAAGIEERYAAVEEINDRVAVWDGWEDCRSLSGFRGRWSRLW